MITLLARARACLAEALARLWPRLVRVLARRRVPLGFVLGMIVLWFAEPTSALVAGGAIVAVGGEALRIWAAGHLEKSREVTRSGPYRWVRHPLYLGTTLIAAGVAVASGSRVVWLMIAVYLLTTIPSAIVAEEAHLREKFGGDYDAYTRQQASPMPRRFSLARARRNREHETIAGVAIGFALLALKARLSLP